MRRVNTALLGKWKWMLGKEEKGLWRDVIEPKYGSWSSLNQVKGNANESSWWKDLKKVCDISFERNWLMME